MAILRVRDAYGNVHDISCIKGKSAYEYAVDGGYSGTESEFAEKMAAELPNALQVQFTLDSNNNITSDKTISEILEAYDNGQYVNGFLTNDSSVLLVLCCAMPEEQLVIFSTLDPNDVRRQGYLFGVVDLGSDIWNISSDMALASLADIPSIPATLPNPNALTITIGDTTVTYDGSVAKSIEIADGSEVSY